MNVPKRYTSSEGITYELQKIEPDGTPIYYRTPKVIQTLPLVIETNQGRKMERFIKK